MYLKQNEEILRYTLQLTKESVLQNLPLSNNFCVYLK